MFFQAATRGRRAAPLPGRRGEDPVRGPPQADITLAKGRPLTLDSGADGGRAAAAAAAAAETSAFDAPAPAPAAKGSKPKKEVRRSGMPALQPWYAVNCAQYLFGVNVFANRSLAVDAVSNSALIVAVRVQSAGLAMRWPVWAAMVPKLSKLPQLFRWCGFCAQIKRPEARHC